MKRSSSARPPSPRALLALLLIAACGESATSGDDDGSGGSGAGTGQGGSSAGTQAAGGSGAAPAGGVAGTGQTGGAGGSGAAPAGGTAGTPTGGASGAGAQGGATPSGGMAGGGMAGAGPLGGAGAGPAGMGGAGAGGAGAGGSGGSPACPLQPIGWASLPGGGFNAPTSGGCNATPVTVSTLAELNSALTGFSSKVIRISGTSINGTVNVTSNTTIEGLPGAVFRGSLNIDTAINVIVRNLTIIGNNCADASDCEDGADAVSINGGSHHVWVDHCDISNGSDGNLDVVDASDYVTVSWTKFSYSGTSRTHRFSNLVGDTDNNAADANKLNVTFHHCWWADRVQERMPRVRYGKVHLFNNLYTASGNGQTVMLGYNGNIRLENNVFIGVENPINSSDYSPNSGAVTATGNVYTGTSGSTSNRGTAFTPNTYYQYMLDPTNGLEQAIRDGAGPE